MDAVENVIKSRSQRRAEAYISSSSVQQHVWETLQDRILSCGALSPTSIVDLGCGTGSHTMGLSQLFPEAEIWGVDRNPDYLGAWKSYRNVVRRCHGVVGDFEFWRPEAPVDWVISSSALHWAKDQAGLLSQIKAYLSEEGRVFLAVFGPQTYQEFQMICDVVIPTRVQIPSQQFWRIAEWEAVLEKEMNLVWMDHQITTLTYHSVLDLLRVMHHTGTAGRSRNPFWTPGLISRLQAQFELDFSGVKVSHEVGFFEAQLK